MITTNLRKRSLSVENVRLYLLVVVSKTATNTAQILSSSNVNFVVQSPNGSAGEILIFANHAIKNNATVITYLESREISCQNVILRNAHSK